MSWWRRSDKTLSKDSYSTPSEYFAVLRAGLREKADHNKLEAQLCFIAAISCTLLSPLFVTLGNGLLWGKVVPAGLSVLAAGLTSWLQLRKPQRLWSIYRRAQRELEREKSHYDFKLAEYGSGEDCDKLLAQRSADIAFRVHEQWEALIPDPDALNSLPSMNAGSGKDGT